MVPLVEKLSSESNMQVFFNMIVPLISHWYHVFLKKMPHGGFFKNLYQIIWYLLNNCVFEIIFQSCRQLSYSLDHILAENLPAVAENPGPCHREIHQELPK